MAPTVQSVTGETTELSSSGHETTQALTSSREVTSHSDVVTSSGNVVTSTTSTTSTSSAMSKWKFTISTTSGFSSTFPQKSTTSTTQSPPWKGVSFGLIGGVALLLLVCIVLIVVICRLKRRLKKAHVTLYPMASAEHTYTPLVQPVKNGLHMEMSKVTQGDDIEEIDSPTFSTPPSPPTFPRSISKSSLDKPPELPTRRPKKFTARVETKAKAKVKSEPQKSTDTADGIENLAFSKDATSEEITPSPSGNAVHTDHNDDDDLYESYDHTLYKKTTKSDKPGGDTEETIAFDNEMPYEVPVKTDTEVDSITEQSSSSGLPEIVFSINKTNEGEDDNEEDMYDNEEVEMKDSGLPIGNGPLDIYDLQTYEDVEDVENTNTVVAETRSNSSKGLNTDGYNDSKQSDSNATVLDADPDIFGGTSMYDCGKSDTKIDSDMDSEPGIYEDYGEDIGSLDIKTNTRLDQSSEEDLEQISRRQNVAAGPENKSVSDEESETGVVLPKVPPRRDLLAQVTGPPRSIIDQVELHQQDEREDSEVMASALVACGDVEMRPGSQVGDIKKTMPLQNSYFLDMEDDSKELSEAQQKRISVHKMGDSEMPLTELLQLYDAEKINDGSNMRGTTGVKTETETSHRGQIDRLEDNGVSNQTSNEILANGNVLDTLEEDELSENLYDIPPPVVRGESFA